MIFPNVQMKILDDVNVRLGPNETDEIHVKSFYLMLGYFQQEEKTREAFDDEGWMRMGDLGFFDDEGFLHITGRKKETMKFNNFQVLPAELEELINSIDGVEGSSVLGVLDENLGNDIIFAFVKKSSNSNVNEQDIVDFVHGKVIDAKKIRGGVHFVDSFPLTPSGKVKKNELKKVAEKIIRKVLDN